MVAYIATESTITVILDGKNRTIQVKSKAHRNETIKALEKYKKSSQTLEDKTTLENFLVPLKRIGLQTDSRLELDEETKSLYLKGTTVPIEPGLGDKIMDFLDNGLPIEPLIKFWESCLRNPHFIAVKELFSFLECNNLPITEDGGFLGYKKLNFTNTVNLPAEFGELFVDLEGTVRNLDGEVVETEVAERFLAFVNEANNPNMVDVHSRTIHQKVGDVVKISRVQFNEAERREACGYGLHIGGFLYMFSGDVRVLCKVFPEDVIACNPNQEKLRTCEYKIIAFVDSKTEVKQLLINLSKQEVEQVEEEEEFENPFVEGDIVKYVGDSDDLTFEDYYLVIQVDGEEISVIDDLGNESYFNSFDFESK